MKKWADYLISEVRYNSENLIFTAIRHQDTDLGITLGEPIDRSTITSDIKNGLSYITIYNGKNSWKKGHKIQTFSIGGIPYLRIDENKVKLDYLGDLPELLLIKSNPILESEPPSNSRGSLPKESAEELPQELDLVPEPEPENEQATPEQIEKLNQLQKQIEELETVPIPEPIPEPPSNSRGSLPKESAEELPQELDLVPEPEPENEQATPEQIEKLNQLQKQIEELETVPIPEPEPIPEPPSNSRGSLPKESAEELPQELDLVPEPENEQATPEQIIQLDDLQRQIDKLENILSNPFLFESKSAEEIIPEQFSKVKELEKEIKKLDGVKTEYDIIQTLQKQNKKLDDIEKKFHDLEKMK